MASFRKLKSIKKPTLVQCAERILANPYVASPPPEWMPNLACLLADAKRLAEALVPKTPTD